MDRGDWQATVHRVTKSQTRLSDYTTTTVQRQSGAAMDGVGLSPHSTGEPQAVTVRVWATTHILVHY